MAKAKAATAAASTIPAGFDPTKAEVVKNLSVPAFKIKEQETRFFRIDSAMRVSDFSDNSQDDADEDKGSKTKKGEPRKKRDPATVVDATDLQSGQIGTLICTSVIKSSLLRNYPDESYVGKGFRITRLEKPEGKMYSKYTVVEIALPD